MNKFFIALILFLTISTPTLFAQSIPFSSDRWEINGKEVRVEQHLGNEALYLKNGFAILKDVEFLNGTIEFDVAVTGERGFMGVFWRLQDRNNYEEFYIRPHQSGNPDANQYTPVFNGAAGWQLYHGEGYGAPVKYVFNEWMHIKIVVSSKSGEVYIRDMSQPAFRIVDMKRKIQAGKIGVINPGDYADAYFSNFSFTAAEQSPMPSAKENSTPLPQGTICSWSVSSVFNEKTLHDRFQLDDRARSVAPWTKIDCEQSGVVNLARLHGISEEKNTVFVKVTIVSNRAQVKKLRFGFSDRIQVYLNDELLYGGNNNYRSRDYRYLGTIGYFDEVYLHLKKGENELWMAVSEDFGGWGIQAKFDDPSGITVK